MEANLYDAKTGDTRFSSCPRSPVSTMLTFLMLDGAAFAHRRTGDPRLRQMLIDSSRRTLQRMNGLDPYSTHWNETRRGQELGIFACNTAHFLGYVASLQAADSKPAGR